MKILGRSKGAKTGASSSSDVSTSSEGSERKVSFLEWYNLALSRPWISSYRLLGERIVKVMPFFEDLRPTLLRSGKRIHFEAYVSLIVLTSIIAFVVGFAITSIIVIALHGGALLVLLLGLGVGLLSGSVGFTTVYALPGMGVDSRKRDMDEELPYTMSHMAILASAGLPPERVFRSLAQSDEKSVVAEESKMIIRDIDMLGFDMLTALANERERSPSKTFSDFLEGFTAATRSGGDLKKYLLSSAKEIMELRRIAAKQLVETLGMIAEAYVSMLVVFPLILIIMFSVMGLVGGSIGGFGVFSVMALVTYVLIPLLALMMLALLDGMLPKR
jgi:flagellar protein FlaJ